MNWATIKKYKGKYIYCTIDGERTRVQITGTDEFDKGSKWISLSFCENCHLTPTYAGVHLGNCNVLFSPKEKRNIYGWRSEDIIKSLELCNAQDV
jgi:hypothetical protein